MGSDANPVGGLSSGAITSIRGGWLLALAIAGSSTAAAAKVVAAEGPVTPAPHIETLTRLTVTGTLRAAVGAVAEPAGEDADKPAATALEVVEHAVAAEATLRYLEQPAGDGELGDRPVIRRYHRAEARLTVDTTEIVTSLPTDAQEVRWAIADGRLRPWLAAGFLTRAERDLLTVPFDPAWQAALEPPADASTGTTWTIKPAGLARLLCIDTIDSGSVTATVERTEDRLLVVQLAGRVVGGVDGVPTQIQLDASYRWRVAGPAEIGLAGVQGRVSEQRQAGHVTPGLDIEATLETTCRRIERDEAEKTVVQPPETGPTADQLVLPRRGPGRPGCLWLADPRGRFDLVHDDRWRMIEKQTGQTVLRLVDHGRLLGQVTIIPLPPGPAVPTLDVFQRDIERSLEGQFNHVVSAGESQRSDGTTILRVASEGEADGLPFRWIHYHVTAPSGGRASLSFMVEVGQLKQFGEVDRELVDGFAFITVRD